MTKTLISSILILSALYASAQTLTWETTVRGSEAFTQGVVLATGSDSSCFVATTSKQAETSEDASLSKYAADGTRLWTRNLDFGGRDHANGVVVDSAGNAYLLTTSETPDHGTESMVTKYSPSGAGMWTTAFGG